MTSDAEGKQYIYDGENRQTEVKTSSGQSLGKYYYDADGRRVKKTSATETVIFVYDAEAKLVAEYSTQVSQNPQVSYLTTDALVSEVFTDGAGRTRKSRIPMSWDTSGAVATYLAQHIEYDVLGRVKQQSIPAETSNVTSSNGNWKVPSTSPDYRGEDGSGNSLLLWTSQTYDWRGRVVQTVSTDNKTTETSYDGCGCAGGEIVTISAEEVEPGKRRKQKFYSDLLDRQEKTEVINWDTNLPLTTTVNKFNERDQVTKVLQYAGAESVNNTYQEVTTTFDGHGRLKTRHYPIEDAGTVTNWAYNPDDSISTITDPRGVVTSFLYNSRGLIESIQYAQPPNNPALPDPKHVPATPTVSYLYDNAGNRTKYPIWSQNRRRLLFSVVFLSNQV